MACQRILGALLGAVLLSGTRSHAELALSSVTAAQRPGTHLVDITYDVACTTTNRVTVSLAVSNGVAAVNATTLSGHVGGNVATGTERLIVWDAGADWGGDAASLGFTVTASVDERLTAPAGMAAIPAGTHSGTDPDFGAYSLTVSGPLGMDRCEVTKAQWGTVASWAATNGYDINVATCSTTGDDKPAGGVTWLNWTKWCNARSQQEGRTPCYTVGGNVFKSGTTAPACNFGVDGYRLPTNDEWEYAARGGAASRRFAWGDDIAHSNANYYSKDIYAYDVSETRGSHPLYSNTTAPVGSFAPNGYGLHDVAGNAWEFCWDASGSSRCARGGDYNSATTADASAARCGYRGFYYPQGNMNSRSGARTVCPATVAQEQAARSGRATAGVDTRDYSLTVTSAHGTPSPAVGVHTGYRWHSSVTCLVNGATTEDDNDWVCTGWSGTGSVPSSGAATNTGPLTLSSVSSSITWNWAVVAVATNRHAYAANTGWIDFSPGAPSGVAFGATFLSGYAYDANCGWLHLGDGTPANGLSYANDSSSDYGVNRDEAGNLSGFAYGANVGWVHFGWAGPTDPKRPRLDPASGVFDGYAYGANAGWIKLRFTRLAHAVTFDLAGHATRTGGGALAQMVYHGTAATAPTLAVDPAWTFTGWSTGFDPVTADVAVTAQYSHNACAVTFMLGAYGTRTGGGALSQSIYYGEAATLPTVGVNPAWRLLGWDLDPPEADLDHVTGAIQAAALYGAVHSISGGGSCAYAANAGWVDFAPSASEGVAFGDSYLSGYAYAANCGWLHFGDGNPADGVRYGNTSSADYGVNHDGAGNLSGFAYGANVGWVAFGWAAADDPYRPRVDLATGLFAGYAHGANVGWLDLGTGLQTLGMFVLDFDGDGISDPRENETFGGLATANATSNFDGDPASDLEEDQAGTNPKDAHDFFRITAVTYAAGYTQADVTFSTVATRLYRIETCDALGGTPDWTDSGLGTIAPDPGGTTTRTISWPGAGARFIHAVALVPLQE